ncbi:zinc ribbon domain-containing protein [Desulfovibrio sp. OttesenSCG-928-C06]|nr:zinc ribbon domain-containing protein [Desulfovibrio sp. OttesenSCG-928-C06]
MQVADLNCPGCNAALSASTRECPYCGRSIVINSFNMIAACTAGELRTNINAFQSGLAVQPNDCALNLSTAFCFLKLKLYDNALGYFEKAIEDNIINSEAYFYYALAMLKGNKAFTTPKKDIDKAISLTNAAIALEPRGIYHYFLAYLKYDFYERKCLNIKPGYAAELEESRRNNICNGDIASIFEILDREVPEAIALGDLAE